MWLVEQRAGVVTKPGARRPCLVKNKIQIQINDPGARQVDRRLRTNSLHGSRSLDGNVASVI